MEEIVRASLIQEIFPFGKNIKPYQKGGIGQAKAIVPFNFLLTLTALAPRTIIRSLGAAGSMAKTPSPLMRWGWQNQFRGEPKYYAPLTPALSPRWGEREVLKQVFILYPLSHQGRGFSK